MSRKEDVLCHRTTIIDANTGVEPVGAEPVGGKPVGSKLVRAEPVRVEPAVLIGLNRCGANRVLWTGVYPSGPKRRGPNW